MLGLIDSAKPYYWISLEQCRPEPVSRANLLLVLKMHYFTEEMINNYFLNMMNIYDDRMSLINDNKNYIYNYNHAIFDYVPVGGVFDKWSKEIANEMLEYYREGETEYLLCLFYSGQTELAYRLLLEPPYTTSAVGKLYAEKLNEALKLPLLSIGFYTGAWIRGAIDKNGSTP
ncbi:hypothetical protein MASR1M74_22940 [Lentimicrobium sp.]